MNEIKSIAYSFALWIINHIVTHIPIWYVRKIFYILLGLRLGKGSRILLGTTFQGIGNIKIGRNTYINKNCHLDGRGGLVIGDNVNISMYSVIISGSHNMKSATFEYRPGKVIIEDLCWLGTRSLVLDLSHLSRGVVLSAGSVLKGNTDAYGVYAGVPARKIKDRCLESAYDVVWRPWFE